MKKKGKYRKKEYNIDTIEHSLENLDLAALKINTNNVLGIKPRSTKRVFRKESVYISR